MAIDDALSDIGAALSRPAPQGVAPTAVLQQQSGIDAALADLAKSPEQLHAEMTARNADTGSIGSALAGAGRFALTAATRGLGGLADFATDPLSPIRRMIDPRLENMEQSVRPHPGQAAGNAVFAATGVPEYQPTTPAGRVGLAAAEGAAGGGPFGVGGALLGAASGLLGQGTQELTGSERLATAAGMLPGVVAPAVRGTINLVGGTVRDTLGPSMSQSYREGLAGEQLRNAAADPDALKSSLMADQPGPLAQSLVPGSMPTTFQLTGDMGLGQLERAQRTQNATPFLERAGEQNKARVGQIEALAPENAAPSAVRDLLKQHLDALDATGEANIQRARQNAQQAMEQAGGTLSPDLYGALMRDQLEAAKSSAKADESRLWQAIDPEGELTIDATPVKQAATQIRSEIPKTAKPPEGEENAVLGFAQMGGTAMPFSDFAALRGRLLGAIREERSNGQTPALRRMQQLRSAMDETISGAADQAAQQENGAVASGTLSSEQTMAARLKELARAWQAENAGSGQAAAVGAGGSGSIPPGAASSFSPMGRGQGPAGGGLGNAPSFAGVQGEPVANFDADAAARYRAAANATRERAQTFNNQIIGPALQERGTEYRMLESRIPERFMSSPEGVQAFLSAGGDAGTLRDALVADLRRGATNPDGTLNPTRFASWQIKRDAALRAFPELKQTLGTAAAAQEAVDATTAAARQQSLDFQRSAARHFLNAEPTQAIQSALNGKNPVGDMGDLSRLVATDPDAKAGLQRAAADYISKNFIGNTEVGTSGVTGIKSDAFQSFMRRSAPALGQVFSPEQIQAMQAIAADLQRSNRSIVGSKIPGQSNTAQDLALQSGKLSTLRAHLGDVATSAGGGIIGYLLGGPSGGLVGSAAGVGKAAVARMKAAGIEKTNQLLTEALLNPELARTLLMVPSPGNRPIIAQRLGRQLGTLAATGATAEQRQPH
jgi:hypothetical protein